MKWITIISLLLVTYTFSACKATKITSSWTSEDHVMKPYHNIMVWGILPQNDSNLRKQMENHLVNDLVSKGYHAIASLDVYKEKAYDKLTHEDIVDEFKSTGVDAVMTIALLSKEKEEKYYPGGYFHQPVDNYGNLDRYYSTVFERVLIPGYYVSTTDYYWQSNLFETKKDKMVYSVRTKSFDPYSTELLAHENGILIIKNMVKKKIIKNPLPPYEQ